MAVLQSNKGTVEVVNQGDKITLRSGEEVIFIKLNRTKFVFDRNGVHYNTPIENFGGIVERAEPKKLSQSYKKLKEGDLFYINHKGQAIAFSFVELKNGKIVGKNPIDGGITTIHISLYGGTINELKKLI